MIESLTTMPDNANRPNIDRIVGVTSMTKWPNSAPTMPNGMIAITTSGQP